jgi:hypothetical protein
VPSPVFDGFVKLKCSLGFVVVMVLRRRTGLTSSLAMLGQASDSCLIELERMIQLARRGLDHDRLQKAD